MDSRALEIEHQRAWLSSGEGTWSRHEISGIHRTSAKTFSAFCSMRRSSSSEIKAQSSGRDVHWKNSMEPLCTLPCRRFVCQSRCFVTIYVISEKIDISRTNRSRSGWSPLNFSGSVADRCSLALSSFAALSLSDNGYCHWCSVGFAKIVSEFSRDKFGYF